MFVKGKYTIKKLEIITPGPVSIANSQMYKLCEI